ncbi:MAG: hypothetical protein WAZ48_06515 [Lysobacteraceae bacterium]
MKNMVVIALIAFGLAACDDPGEGPRFEAGRKKAELVLAAIQEYRSDVGRYPASLDDLAPKYLRKKDLGEHVPGRSIAFYYEPYPEGSFLFEFAYTGPGRNRCEYVPDSKPTKWSCLGYY